MTDDREDGSSDVREARLRWTATGQGPLVLWAHGMTNDRWALEDAGLYDWDPIPEAGRRLLRFDARGHGESTGEPDPQLYTWPSLAADVLALIDDVSPDEPVDAIGSSMGSASLLIAALQSPDRFRRLVLTAPPTAWQTRQQQAALYETGAGIAEHDGAAAFERLVAAQPKVGLFQDLPDYPPRLRADDRLLPSVLRGGAASNLPEPDELRDLSVPTLILSYADDPAHPVATGEELHRVIPGSQFSVARSVDELRGWTSTVLGFLTD